MRLPAFANMKCWTFVISNMGLSRIRLFIVTLWIGSVWTIGYLVAPTLFATLSDKALAGTIAGTLFRAEAWLSIFCGAALLVLSMLQGKDSDSRKQRKTGFVLVISMLACTLIGYFALHPFMAALRDMAGPTGIMTPDNKMQFGILHGVSSALYLVQSLLGVALLFKIR